MTLNFKCTVFDWFIFTFDVINMTCSLICCWSVDFVGILLKVSIEQNSTEQSKVKVTIVQFLSQKFQRDNQLDSDKRQTRITNRIFL